MASFQDLELSAPVLQALEQMGYDEPSPVQAAAIPVLMAGRDVIAQARTGTGKTAAFGIPLVERVDPRSPAVQGLVLAPTRELAIQVAAEITRLGRFRQVSVAPIYGGQSYDHQFKALRRGVQIVVATPGRLLDHLERTTIDLSHVRWAILDEADEMLTLGFLEDVTRILDRVPAERQVALFSATMPKPIVDLSERYLHSPERITLSRPRELTVPEVSQLYYEVPRPYKIEALARLLDAKDPERALVFCATKRMVDELTEELIGRGYRAEAIHGDMSQAQRERVLGMAREGRLDVLVATDVAARGIDIPEVTHVFNFDLPQDPEYYVHRIGRTARAGRTGEAITLVSPWEVREIQFIERITGAKIRRAEVPTIAEVEARERRTLAQRIERSLETEDWGPYYRLAESLAETHDPVNVAAAALALLAGPAKVRPEIPTAPPRRAGRPAGRPAGRRVDRPGGFDRGRPANRGRTGDRGGPPGRPAYPRRERPGAERRRPDRLGPVPRRRS